MRELCPFMCTMSSACVVTCMHTRLPSALERVNPPSGETIFSTALQKHKRVLKSTEKHLNCTTILAHTRSLVHLTLKVSSSSRPTHYAPNLTRSSTVYNNLHLHLPPPPLSTLARPPQHPIYLPTASYHIPTHAAALGPGYYTATAPPHRTNSASVCADGDSGQRA